MNRKYVGRSYMFLTASRIVALNGPSGRAITISCCDIASGMGATAQYKTFHEVSGRAPNQRHATVLMSFLPRRETKYPKQLIAMWEDEYPEYSETEEMGERGRWIVEGTVRDSLRWLFRQIQKSDLGIDGFVEI